MSEDTSMAGEFELIRRHLAPLAAGNPAGIGLEDDAAVFSPPPGREIVVTTDTMVEAIHYPKGEAPAFVARKLLRVNLSDLAAMGARPELYFLNAAWPDDMDEAWIADFARGLEEDQEAFGISLAGGDTVSTPGPATFTLTAIGSVPAGGALRRGGAKAGDDVYVSGTIGDGALGLDVVLERPLPGPSPAEREELRRRYRLPEPRVELGQALASLGPNAGIRAAADVSDGLVADLGHICEASKVAAVIRAGDVPLSAAARAAVAGDASAFTRVVTGGDDYELVFTASPESSEAIAAIAARLALQVTRIGEIVSGSGVAVRDVSGKDLRLKATGFRHR